MTQKDYKTLYELQHQIRCSLEQNFAFPEWITAEIGDIKINRSSGHCYMELTEKGASNAVPKARASAVIWRSSYGIISSYFRSATGGELAVGMKVLLKASVSFHELYGISLVISDINPSYTLGDLAAQREQTIARLKSDGTYDMNRELELPFLTQNIAVISSPTAAGFQDFNKELESSPYLIRTTLFDAIMQGAGAPVSIIAALDAVAERMDEFDAVVIIRGGGSQSDLSCFDSYELSSVVAQYPLPIIAGIGHDKDVSVVDLVAHLSLKTPTAVAGYLCDRLSELDYQLDQMFDLLANSSQRILEKTRANLEQMIFSMSRVSDKMTQSVALTLQSLQSRLESSAQALLAKHKATIENYQTQINSLRPEKILSLGFSIVRLKGKAVNSSDSLEDGDQIEITMSKGTTKALVQK